MIRLTESNSPEVNAADDPLLEEFGVRTHELADRMTAPKWNEPGICICGVPLPPMSQWKNAGMDWSSHVCPSCGRGYVDEEDFIAIYDDGLDQGDES